MKIYPKAPEHPQPEGPGPIRNLQCHNCGRHYTTRGTWSEATGRWYLGFTCPNCEVYQSLYVSLPREEKAEQEKTAVRQAFKEEEED